MAYDEKQHHRRSIRLRDHNYAEPGAYFVTLCTEGHLCLFGEVEGDIVRLNPSGQIVEQAWRDLPNHYPYMELDVFVVMPNHVHMIVILTERSSLVGAGFKPALTPVPARTPDAPKRYGLGEIIRAFKTFSSRQINKCRGTPGASLWQRNYYEHIIRHERALRHIRGYIVENPQRWAHDRENPAATTPEAPDAWQIR
jgi:putative transposase